MSNIRFDPKTETYKTCGCGGKPIEAVQLDPTWTQIVINGAVAKQVKGESGASYWLMPNTITLDMDVNDAAALIADGTVRAATSIDKNSLIARTTRLMVARNE